MIHSLQMLMYLQVSVEKWMSIPDMGYVIASKYNVVSVCLQSKA